MGTTGCLCLGKSSLLTVDSIIISVEEDGTFLSKYEPPRGKTNNVVCEQVRHKSGCAVTEAG